MDTGAAKVMNELKANRYAPVYFLQGEETYYIDLISDYIESHVIGEAERGFNQVVVYGKDVTVASILTHAKRYPMMAERQVVIVREAQDIPDLQKEVGAKLMLDYITNPMPSTILVFCHKHKTLDRRRELGKKVDKLTTSVVFKKAYENQLPAFVEAYFSDRGHKIEDSAVSVLCEYVGNDLKRLANEMDKVMIVSAAGESVTSKMVMAQVGISRDYNVFELQKALIQRDSIKANKIVNYFQHSTKKNPLIPVIAFLFSFYSKLLVASSSPDKSDESLINLLKIRPFALKDYSNALSNYSEQELVRCIKHISLADLKLKGINSSSSSEAGILKELIYLLIY